METVIKPIDRELIRRELTADKFVGKTRKGDNFIFEITAEDSPFTMREIGRLREVSFRLGGGGSGKACDIDSFDTDPHDAYKQLLVWDNENQEIIGGYRYIVCSALDTKKMATSEILRFSEQFKREFLPWTIELGRSFIQPNYQSANIRRKSIFALDNLWDGLGALVAKYENMKYFFGKVTMYVGYNKRARNILLNFLHLYFPDPDKLVTAEDPIDCSRNDPYIHTLFNGLEYKEAYKVLTKELKTYGENIPPLINSYMNLSPSMRVFDTAVNKFFGGVEETGILIKISDIYPEKIDRHVVPIRKWALDTKSKWWKFKKHTNL